MPKIVDHDKKRLEIALKSTEIFLEFGYKNLGMRQLCERLGMSKSAVYHYYKSKDELFRAATEAIVNYDEDALTGRPLSLDTTKQQQIDNFILIFNQIAPRYFKEFKLVSDYIEVIGLENVADDPCMQLANQKYKAVIAKYVSREHSEELYTLMLGLLNQGLMMGKNPDKNYIALQVSKFLK